MSRWFWAMLPALWGAQAAAHEVMETPRDRAVKGAAVLARAKVVEIARREARCLVYQDVTLELGEVLRGTPPSKTVRYTLMDHTWNPKENCPSVSYAVPPRAHL